MFACGKTGFGTSSINCLINYDVVTLCRNFFLCNGNSATNGALLTFCKTGCGTSCVLTCYSFLGVTKSLNSFLCNENFITYRTVLTSGKTGCGTSGSYCLVNYFGVTGCLNYKVIGGSLSIFGKLTSISCKIKITSITVLICFVAVFGTGRFIVLCSICEVMLESFNSCIINYFTTYSTFYCGVTTLKTGS